jgi:NAD(P)-dependent dehydrogenase (short-subunit alcohol dehydrogenase family)
MKTVLITGVGRGIGKALAERFIRNGDFVLGTYLNSPPKIENHNFESFPLDLSKPEDIKKCVEKIKNFNRKLDILINNAGVNLDEDETHVVDSKLRNTLEVNLIGLINFTECLLPLVNRGGHIINVSSSAGSLTDADFDTASHYPFHYPAYKISKAALNMYTRSLAMNLKHENKDITVSSVHPGWVKTDMGGEDAEMEPSEAAEHIFRLANTQVETGQFWFKGKKFPW